MTQLTRRRNTNGRLFPSFRNDFLANRFFMPELFDLDDDLFNTHMAIPPANYRKTIPKKEVTVSKLKKNFKPVNKQEWDPNH
jgi:hypothetical protein